MQLQHAKPLACSRATTAGPYRISCTKVVRFYITLTRPTFLYQSKLEILAFNSPIPLIRRAPSDVQAFSFPTLCSSANAPGVRQCATKLIFWWSEAAAVCVERKTNQTTAKNASKTMRLMTAAFIVRGREH